MLIKEGEYWRHCWHTCLLFPGFKNFRQLVMEICLIKQRSTSWNKKESISTIPKCDLNNGVQVFLHPAHVASLHCWKGLVRNANFHLIEKKYFTVCRAMLDYIFELWGLQHQRRPRNVQRKWYSSKLKYLKWNQINIPFYSPSKTTNSFLILATKFYNSVSEEIQSPSINTLIAELSSELIVMHQYIFWIVLGHCFIHYISVPCLTNKYRMAFSKDYYRLQTFIIFFVGNYHTNEIISHVLLLKLWPLVMFISVIRRWKTEIVVMALE